MKAGTKATLQCPICGLETQIASSLSAGNGFSALNRLRGLLYQRGVCPSCAIVFEVSRAESCLFRFLPIRRETIGLPRRIRNSNRQSFVQAPVAAEERLRPALVPPRDWTPRGVGAQPCNRVPLRLDLQSDLIGLDLRLVFKQGQIFEYLSRAMALSLKSFRECWRELFLPLLRTLFAPLEEVRPVRPRQDLLLPTETQVYEIAAALKEKEQGVDDLIKLNQEQDRLVH